MTWSATNNNSQQILINATTSTSSVESPSTQSHSALAAQGIDPGEENLAVENDQFAQHEAERDRKFAQLFNSLESNAQNQQNGGLDPDHPITRAMNGMIAKNGGGTVGARMTVPSPALTSKLVKVGATETPEFGQLRNYMYAGTRPGAAGPDPKTTFALANQAYGAVHDKMVAQQGTPLARAQAANSQSQTGSGQSSDLGGVNLTTMGSGVNASGEGGTAQGSGWNANNVPTGSAPTQLFSTGETGQSTGLFGPNSADAWLNKVGPGALVYIVMLESMQEDNKDKAYFLNQINKFNIIGQHMNAYLSNVLEPAQAALTSKQNACGKNANDRAAQTVTVQRQYNWDYELWQNKNTGSSETGYQVQDVKADSNELSSLMKEFDQDQQTLNNKRDQVSNAFTSADQTSQQCFSMLTSFVKSLNDSSNSIIRNIAS